MNFKLDENLGRRTQQVFSLYGHRADTVAEENLSGTNDQHLFEICLAEDRCLVSLDMDFADIPSISARRVEGYSRASSTRRIPHPHCSHKWSCLY
jgi:predicted nuclease of predicted toxin-antitoxin system